MDLSSSQNLRSSSRAHPHLVRGHRIGVVKEEADRIDEAIRLHHASHGYHLDGSPGRLDKHKLSRMFETGDSPGRLDAEAAAAEEKKEKKKKRKKKKKKKKQSKQKKKDAAAAADAGKQQKPPPPPPAAAPAKKQSPPGGAKKKAAKPSKPSKPSPKKKRPPRRPPAADAAAAPSALNGPSAAPPADPFLASTRSLARSTGPAPLEDDPTTLDPPDADAVALPFEDEGGDAQPERKRSLWDKLRGIWPFLKPRPASQEAEQAEEEEEHDREDPGDEEIPGERGGFDTGPTDRLDRSSLTSLNEQATDSDDDDGDTVLSRGDTISEDSNFHDTGSCAKLTGAEKRLLLLVLFVSALVVAVPLLVIAADGLDDAVAIPTESPSIPPANPSLSATFASRAGTPVTKTASFRGTPITEVSLELIRDTGLTVTLSVPGDPSALSHFSAFDSATYPQGVTIKSNVTADREPNGFGALLQKNPSFVAFSFDDPDVTFRFGPAAGMEAYSRELISLVLLPPAADLNGAPVHFTVGPQEVSLIEKDLEKDTSKVTAATTTLSAIVSVGSTAAVGHMPRLSLISAAFDCPSDGFAEIDWMTNPLSLVGFPDIPMGHEGLGPHVSAVVGGFVIVAGLALVLAAATSVSVLGFQSFFPVYFSDEHKERNKTVRIVSTNWQSMAAFFGFPNHTLASLVFLAPGISLGTFSVLFYHDEALSKVLVAALFTAVVVLPAGYMLYFLESPLFTARVVAGDPDQPTCFQWLQGTREWMSPDPTFLGRTRLLYDTYRRPVRWYLSVEILVSAVMGGIEAVQPSSLTGCRWRSWSLLVVNTGQLASLVMLRPFIAVFELIYAVAAVGLMEATICFIVLNHHEEDKAHWSSDAAEASALASLWLIRFKACVDLFIFFLDVRGWFADRREMQELKKREEEELEKFVPSSLPRIDEDGAAHPAPRHGRCTPPDDNPSRVPETTMSLDFPYHSQTDLSEPPPAAAPAAALPFAPQTSSVVDRTPPFQPPVTPDLPLAPHVPNPFRRLVDSPSPPYYHTQGHPWDPPSPLRSFSSNSFANPRIAFSPALAASLRKGSGSAAYSSRDYGSPDYPLAPSSRTAPSFVPDVRQVR
ncbi:hypothetical protein DIPPA_12422 [Diplonema papillatum]|nr:hypothetical protein DIPPA_12422 [Diplonema papillatum]